LCKQHAFFVLTDALDLSKSPPPIRIVCSADTEGEKGAEGERMKEVIELLEKVERPEYLLGSLGVFEEIPERILHLFACDVAEHALEALERNEIPRWQGGPRKRVDYLSRGALQVKRRWIEEPDSLDVNGELESIRERVAFVAETYRSRTPEWSAAYACWSATERSGRRAAMGAAQDAAECFEYGTPPGESSQVVFLVERRRQCLYLANLLKSYEKGER